ncbi:conjugative transposon protein TraK [Flavitalea sp. BT771]|uniref:conjugative transposon protein TraK n=1 Tax=Flavitalea sp. BT771 TaxID=3063329 RepID=UPI0026E46F3C|nr:conjugative transposon protein TraK [Flavitalea sp. BT771]MDO6433279.1 conjugative transposon protein TraK [Flavitalea sp. BT771]MDV6222816.1 conjugative transposon protein TraK [Flavitalea sp. BT771]
MFNKTRNIERAFQLVRLFCLVVVLGCLVTTAFIVTRSIRSVERARQTVYVLSAGKVLEAMASDRKENIPVEAKDHIRAFHQLFFTLAPDEKVIGANITRALYLADASAKKLYDNLKENGYYAGIIAGNVSQSILVDSVSLDMTAYPYYFKCWATQQIVRPTSVVTRSLVTEGWLRNCTRSENDPHGFLIERWSTVENRDLKVADR